MIQPQPIAEFPYRVRWTFTFFVVVFSGLCTAVIGYKAATNDRSIIINGIIDLGPDSASIFLWVLATFFSLFTAMGIMMAVQRVLWPMRIAFDEVGIVAPRGPLSRTEIMIPYQEILGLRVYRMHSQDFIELIRPQGKYTIRGLCLPSDADVRRVTELIVTMCPHLR